MNGLVQKVMSQTKTAEDIIAALNLKPHPTCGYVRESFRSPHIVPRAGLPGRFDGPRPFGSVLYFLVTPQTEILLHRIRSDQMYHFYAGDPLEVLLLFEDGRGEIATIGSPIAQLGPQLLIPGGTFHMSRTKGSQGYSLLATTEWPAVEPTDVEAGDPHKLITTFPQMADAIRSFTRLA